MVNPSTLGLLTNLRQQVQTAESDVRRLQDQLLAAERRAALAEKAARDGWDFARIVLRTGRRGER